MRWIRSAWTHEYLFAGAKALHLHPVVKKIRISRRDAHFAAAEIEPKNSRGKQTLETARVGLVQAAGIWYPVWIATYVGPICSKPTPRPWVDLFCP